MEPADNFTKHKHIFLLYVYKTCYVTLEIEIDFTGY